MAPLFQTLTFFLFLISQVSAATTFYLAITDRTGKALLTNPSTVKTAPRQAVQISSLAWTSSRPIDAASGLPSGKLKISGLTINRTADANSPLILLQEMTNSVLRTAVVSAMVPNAAGTLTAQTTYTLTNAIVSSFSQGPISADGALTETILLTFQKLELKSGANTVAFDANGVSA